ncbi:MAG: ATP-dependent helicase [Acholeplasmatales bacterium]
MIDLGKLNKEQLEAVMHKEGPCMVVAGAGSGKTRTLTYRVAKLIEVGVHPDSIVAVTFTNKAAREMKERVVELVGKKASLAHVSTFHSFCAGFLRDEITKLDERFTRRFLIIDEEDSKQIIRDTVKELNYDANKFNSNRLKEEFSKFKNNPHEILDRDDKNVYDAYQKYLIDNNSLDFDDLILYTIKLLKKDSLLKEYYNKRYEYILVDEFQDTNKVQYELIKLLAGSKKNIFVVGDPDQSIYSFRGANYENQNRFIIEFQPKQIILNKNYRSKTNILNVSNNVIKFNSSRVVSKDLYSDLGEGVPVEYKLRASDRDEAYFVTKMIERFIESGYSYNDIAVLYRTNSISRVFEESFLKNDIPYVIYGGISFFQRKEIKDILSYLRLCLNKEDNISLKRIINTPRRKLGQTTISKLETFAALHNISMFDALDKIDLGGSAKTNLINFKELILSLKEKLEKVEYLENIIDIISVHSGYNDMLIAEGSESKDRLENIQELKAVFYQASIDYGLPLLDTVERILDELSLYTSLDIVEEGETVKLATVHQVKGLEFKIVFIVALEEDIFPHVNASNLYELEEERRVFYVALTRAKERLILSSTVERYRFGISRPSQESRFISEAGIETEENTNFTPYDFVLRERKRKEPENLNEGDKVIHDTFGLGVVVSMTEDMVAIAFKPPHGVKMFIPNHPSLKKVKN